MKILMIIEVLSSLKVPAPSLMNTSANMYIVIKVSVEFTEDINIRILYKKIINSLIPL